MAAVVLIHGIGKEQLSADSLEASWLPALAGGVRNSGADALADRLWRNGRPGDINVRMAFYGNLFISPDAQGSDGDEIHPESEWFAEALATEWLQAATERADDPRDRAEAIRALAIRQSQDAGQGVRAAARPMINALSRLRWFATTGMAIGGKYINPALSQVTRYFTDYPIRQAAQNMVGQLITPQTKLVIAHSLGSVVAFEALHTITSQPVALLTLGSPLGLKNIIYEQLLPHPPTVPLCLSRWDNLVDRDDLVAGHLDLASYFPPAPGRSVTPCTFQTLDNGSSPHDAEHYLTKATTGRIVSSALEAL